tara:strand:- start:658 stop:771 length:114 start_codon:yes stop_codon:yes gene_type:complete
MIKNDYRRGVEREEKDDDKNEEEEIKRDRKITTITRE